MPTPVIPPIARQAQQSPLLPPLRRAWRKSRKPDGQGKESRVGATADVLDRRSGFGYCGETRTLSPESGEGLAPPAVATVRQTAGAEDAATGGSASRVNVRLACHTPHRARTITNGAPLTTDTSKKLPTPDPSRTASRNAARARQ